MPKVPQIGEMDGKTPRRLDGGLLAILGCVAVMVLLVVAALLHWPVPWWIYAVAFSLCLVTPLWFAWRYRRVSRK